MGWVIPVFRADDSEPGAETWPNADGNSGLFADERADAKPYGQLVAILELDCSGSIDG